MEEIIAAVAAKAGIEPAQADNALRIILNFLHKDGPSETIEALTERLGARSYLAGAPKAGGLMGAIGGMLGGTGGAMAAFSALQSQGLDFGQIQSVVKELIALARRELGDAQTETIVAAVPGLSQLL